jgi:hypothetical protein
VVGGGIAYNNWWGRGGAGGEGRGHRANSKTCKNVCGLLLILFYRCIKLINKNNKLINKNKAQELKWMPDMAVDNSRAVGHRGPLLAELLQTLKTWTNFYFIFCGLL